MSEKDEGIAPGGSSSKAQDRTAVPGASAADAALVQALRRGDEEAFTRLVDQHHEALRRIARLYVPSAAVADEVVQDTWLAVIRGLWAFEGRSTLRTWILRILINRSKTRAVREGRMVAFSDLGAGPPGAPEVPGGGTPQGAAGDWEGRAVMDDRPATGRRSVPLYDPGLSPEARLLSEEAQAQVRTAIDALPANQRLVITLRDLEGCSSEEVCNVLRLSETNQRVILHRARSNVRTLLEAHFRQE